VPRGGRHSRQAVVSVCRRGPERQSSSDPWRYRASRTRPRAGWSGCKGRSSACPRSSFAPNASPRPAGRPALNRARGRRQVGRRLRRQSTRKPPADHTRSGTQAWAPDSATGDKDVSESRVGEHTDPAAARPSAERRSAPMPRPGSWARRGRALHQLAGDPPEAEALIQSVRVLGGEQNAQPVESRMVQGRPHQSDPQPPAAMLGQHEPIRQPGEARLVCHQAGETGLLAMLAKEATG
jgi:hypothetical protein